MVVDILSSSQQQNAVGFDTCMKMETSEESKNEQKIEEVIEEDLPEEGEITDDEPEPTPQISSSRSRSHTSSSGHHRSSQHRHSPSRSSRSKSSRSPSTRSSKHSKPAPKYKDFDGKTTKPVVGEEVMMESWINGVHNKKRTSPMYDANEEYYSSQQDVEMKDVEQKPQQSSTNQTELVDEYGDVDFRQQIDPADEQKRSRRRSASPLDDFGTIKRPRTDSNEDLHPPPTKRGAVKNRWTEKTICKFFREGFCREGESCVYSHNAEDSHRRPELCRFYAQGYCKRGLACPNLHGEYPCKAYHKGECSKEECQFSHQPLNDYTEPIFDQMMRDEELAKKLMSNAGIKPKRRVLLPIGPEEWDTYFSEDILTENSLPTTVAAANIAPAVSNGAQQKPVVTTNPSAQSKASSFGFFNAVPSHTQSRGPPTHANHPNSSPLQQQPPITTQTKRMSPPQQQNETFSLTDILGGKFSQSSTTKSTAPSTSVSSSLIQDSLQSLQSMFDTNIVDESPKSPPQSGIVVSTSAPEIPTTRGYVAYPLSIPDTGSSLDLNLIQQLTSGLYKNDPRLKRMAEKQFDLVSKTLEQQGGFQAILNQQQKAALPARPVVASQPNQPAPVADPRTKDPRMARAPAAADLPPSLYPPESDEFKSMIEKQIKMANEMSKGKAEDFDMRAAPSSYETPSTAQRPGDYYERRQDSHSYRGHPGRYEGSSRGAARGTGRYNRHADDYGKRYHAKEDWNKSPSDNPPHPKQQTSPARPITASPKEDSARGGSSSAVPMTLREKRKDNQFESPLAARRF